MANGGNKVFGDSFASIAYHKDNHFLVLLWWLWPPPAINKK